MSQNTPSPAAPSALEPVETEKPSRLKRIVSLVAFPTLIVALVVLVAVFKDQIGALIANRDVMHEWILAQGPNSVLVFILAQVVQVVAFFIPGEVTQAAGGFIFGTWYGTLWSVIGIAIGSAINYCIGLLLGRAFIVAAFSKEWVEKIERFASKGKTEAAMFVLFILPAFPKDILTFLAGMSKMKFIPFVVISMVARFPALFLSSLTAASAQQGDTTLAIVLLALVTCVFFVALFFRDKLLEKAEILLHGKKKDAAKGE